MTTDTDTQATAPAAEPASDRQVKKLAKNIRKFATAHGGSADAVVEHIGRGTTRIVLVGADGAWGDQVAKGYDVALKAVETGGVTLHEEFPNDVAARVKTGRYEWTRMAGIQVGGPAND
jgi:folate-dependent phosphoribosylglycinamide formyltransferase PurN